MENNNIDNNIGANMENNIGKKKNNSIMIIIIILIIAIIAMILFKKMNPQTEPKSETLGQSETELNNAVTYDTTASINSNLNSIEVNDTSEADLQTVDQELGNL